MNLLMLWLKLNLQNEKWGRAESYALTPARRELVYHDPDRSLCQDMEDRIDTSTWRLNARSYLGNLVGVWFTSLQMRQLMRNERRKKAVALQHTRLPFMGLISL